MKQKNEISIIYKQYTDALRNYKWMEREYLELKQTTYEEKEASCWANWGGSESSFSAYCHPTQWLNDDRKEAKEKMLKQGKLLRELKDKIKLLQRTLTH